MKEDQTHQDPSQTEVSEPIPVRFRFYLVVGFVFAMLLIGVIWWMGPAPPRHIVIATGEREGAYAELGREYKRRLEQMGISVTLQYTNGSVENLNRLLEGRVDVALAQAGTYEVVAKKDREETLRCIAAVQLEPVWVFYRGEVCGNLAELQRRPRTQKPVERPLRINVGQKNSGTQAVANNILRANGIEGKEAMLSYLPMKESAVGLKKGTLDVGFFVSSPNNPIIEEELMPLCENVGNSDEELHVLNFTRQLAYTQRFPYLSRVTLGQGVLDLENNIPHEDVKLLATSAMFVCRRDLHPHAIEQILIAADQIHASRDLVAPLRQFPSSEGVDITLHPAAKAHLQSGQSFLTRLLPYWGLWLFFKLQLVIIPLLLVWLPFFKLLPFAYRLRINWLLRQHYIMLRGIEDTIEQTDDPETIQQKIEELDKLREDLDQHSRKVPAHLQINVYQWRLHVSHVRAEARERMWRLKQERTKNARLAEEGKEAADA